MGTIEYEDFRKIEMRIGKIIRVEPFPKARKPAYKIWADFGKSGIKKTSAQITDLYSQEELEDRLIVAVVNFPPKQIADFTSEFLLLGVDGEEPGVILLTPERKAPLGSRIY